MIESVAQWGWLFVQLVWARVVIMWGLLDSARSLCLPIYFFLYFGVAAPRSVERPLQIVDKERAA